ncbi:MAG TPA: SusE domain-containing protein [Flavisolibacter sp.]|nr:SusE domain-containing protein [Flavisolibacter sp.]
MKKTLKYLFGIFAVAAVVASCKKDENRITYEAGTAPVLTATQLSGFTTNLMQVDSLKPFMKLSWTNPNYRFTTGTSSQNVNYVLQIDTTGSNFTNPGMKEVSFASGLDSTFTVRTFNTLLANVLENIPHNMEMRIKATLGAAGSVPLYSNVIKLTLRPYLDVAVPVPTANNLWITGDAASSGWSNPLGAPHVTAQKFTKVSTTLYELILAMPGGGNYKLLQDNGNWGTQYHMITGGTWEAGKFEQKDADPGFPGPPSGGTYKLSFNFKTGEYKVTKQ